MVILETNNYRPVSIIPAVSIAFEIVIGRKERLSDHQYGFQQRRSAGDLAVLLTSGAFPALV